MNRSLVETCVLGLNHMNHSLLFGEAPDNENAYQAWKAERPEWGDMFDVRRGVLIITSMDASARHDAIAATAYDTHRPCATGA